MNLRDAKYLTRYKNDIIIFVSPTKLMDRLEEDSPEFSIRGGKNQIGNRVQRAKEYILKNWNNPDAKKNTKNWFYQIFQPSICGIYNGGLSFSDGRHRVLAAEELGIPEVAIEIPRNQEKLFDYMKVDNVTNESPDYIGQYGLNFRDDDSVPFGCYRSSDQKIVIVGIGERGCAHDSIESYSRVMKGSQMFHEFSGRAWLKKKIISFWEFPDKETFKKIIDGLEIKLKRKGWIKKPMWNNGWKVEIIMVKGEVPVDVEYEWNWPNEQEFDEVTHKEIPNENVKLIPIEDYLKSENFPDEIKQWHLMNSREKEEARKSGKDPLKYWKSLGKDVPLAYKQAIYQEKMITKFIDFENRF